MCEHTRRNAGAFFLIYFGKEFPMSEFDYAGAVRSLLEQRPGEHKAFVHTYGCQQNEADSEKLRGYLRAMGFGFTQDEFAAGNTRANGLHRNPYRRGSRVRNIQYLRHSGKRRAESFRQRGHTEKSPQRKSGYDNCGLWLYGSAGAYC